jgi:hypothetical protein
MDNLRAFEEDQGYSAADDEPAIEAPPEIGVDERRMHVRAYNYWVSLLDGRPYPSIGDLEPHTLDDFGPHSVLLDFSEGTDDPKVQWLGHSLREECELIGDIRKISDVPKRSLLSRLTDHYLQIIANCAPIGFEAEFVGQRGRNTMYRGILMPFSSDGDTIDFIYGVINWKEVADSATSARIAQEAAKALAAAPAVESSPVWADGPNAEPMEAMDSMPGPISAAGEDWDIPSAEPEQAPPLPADAGLADRLSAARDSADAVKSADVRSRSALYAALSQAYDFALAAEDEPEDYAELLEDAGLKAQARAPMTPVVKLVFGVDYDKSRLTEFAAALSWARREHVPASGFRDYVDGYEGGLKGLVQAERKARRPEPRPDPTDALRAALREAVPFAFAEIDAGTEEFVLFVVRNEGNGRIAFVAPPVADQALVDKVIRKAAA